MYWINIEDILKYKADSIPLNVNFSIDPYAILFAFVSYQNDNNKGEHLHSQNWTWAVCEMSRRLIYDTPYIKQYNRQIKM